MDCSQLANPSMLPYGPFCRWDRCCQSQLLAEAAGQMERIQDDVAKLTKTQVGTEMAMWASFQPLYDLMLEKDDSFLN